MKAKFLKGNPKEVNQKTRNGASKSEALEHKKKGHVFERSMKGGWEKVRENVSEDEFKKHYSRTHKIGAVKGKPMYSLR